MPGLTRRGALSLVPLAGFHPLLWAQEGELGKREFMERAIKDIEATNARRKAEMEKSGSTPGAAPLFMTLPTIRPFVDWDYYYLEDDLVWSPPKSAAMPSPPVIRAPKGFVTDLASVPPLFWSKYPPMGRYAYPAIVHDYLYWTQTGSRQAADEALVAAMRDTSTDAQTISRFKTALDRFGKKAWESNKAARKNKERRVLIKFPPNALVSWKEWRVQPGVFGEY